MGEQAAIPLPLERVAPETTRLVVVDVQNDFAADGGWFDRSGQDLTLLRRAIDDLVEFIPVARAAGIRPIFVQAIYDEKWLSQPMLERHQLVGFDTKHCQSGTWGAEFYKVSPEEGDDVIVKHRYSAFIGTELDPLLRAQGVENLIFTGITTNVCVESTARDAYMHDYHVVVVSDLTASYAQAPHDATLDNIRRAFGRVVTSAEILDVWRAADLLPQSVGSGVA
ncbi:MAG TPA: isochorismatase family cysteine hydrolase [Actinomycetota bacterium]|jgi:ureidoacrylate peracid hydrolase